MYSTDSLQVKFDRRHRQWIIFWSQIKVVALISWELWPVELEVQKNLCLALFIQILLLKQFLLKDNCIFILPTCHSSMQNYYKILF